MHDYPKTSDEARKYRYREWAGNPNGSAYVEGKCAYEIFSSIPTYQCTRPNGHGVSGLYCKQHAKKVSVE